MARPRAARKAIQGGAVRLTLPAKVAYDLGALERSLKSLAERLGHPACATGCDTLFIQMERDFSIGEDVMLNPQPLPPQGGVGLPTDPVPWQSHAVQVMIPERLNNSITGIQKALATTLGKLGCPECCSGFDILFRRELDLVAFDDRGTARGFGRFR